MKFHKILTFAVIAALSASFVACSDDDDDNKFDNTMLPTSVTYSFGEYSSTFTLNYLPETTLESTDKEHINGRIYSYKIFDEDFIDNCIIEYYPTGNDIKTLTNNGVVYTYKYTISPKNPKLRIVEKIRNNITLDVIYTIDSKGLLLSVMHLTPFRYITSYGYAGNNVTKMNETALGEKISFKKTSSWYGKNSGIFRNVTTPKWFLMTELSDITTGQITNNVSKTEFVRGDKAIEVVGVNRRTTSFDYTWLHGFPSRINTTYITTGFDEDGKEFKETSTSSTSVTYNIAK